MSIINSKKVFPGEMFKLFIWSESFTQAPDGRSSCLGNLLAASDTSGCLLFRTHAMFCFISFCNLTFCNLDYYLNKYAVRVHPFSLSFARVNTYDCGEKISSWLSTFFGRPCHLIRQSSNFQRNAKKKHGKGITF